jgi:hypothetical protein
MEVISFDAMVYTERFLHKSTYAVTVSSGGAPLSPPHLPRLPEPRVQCGRIVGII